jgi:hypothetical protein
MATPIRIGYPKARQGLWHDKKHKHDSMLYKINLVSEIEIFQEINTGFDID